MKQKVIEWLFNGEVGISSKTIAASVLRVDFRNADIPYDKADFSRCYKLVKFADIPISELEILAENYPKWKPLIENWNELIFRYDNNMIFYEYLKTLK
jgi:hypothetical protein